jgi:hypothetical protein
VISLATSRPPCARTRFAISRTSGAGGNFTNAEPLPPGSNTNAPIDSNGIASRQAHSPVWPHALQSNTHHSPAGRLPEDP